MFRPLLIAALLGATPAAARPDAAALLRASLADYTSGNFAAARPRLQLLANQGSAIAETLLGVMAAKGQGRPADPATATALWLRAANRGYPPAQLALAKAFARGAGIPADPGEAWLWARLAAASGDTGISIDAARLAAALEPRLGRDRVAALELRRASWRPWAG